MGNVTSISSSPAIILSAFMRWPADRLLMFLFWVYLPVSVLASLLAKISESDK